MTTAQSIELFVIINLMTIGLSHFLQPDLWVSFFQYLAKKGMVGNIFNAMLSLGLGSFIIAFHPVYSWPMLLVTIYGILQLFKGMIYLLVPSIGLRSISKVNQKGKEKFKWVGIILLILSVLISYQLWIDLR